MDDVVEAASEFARASLARDASGHDWWYARRVSGLASLIAEREGADDFVCRLAAWVHDVADYKVSGDEEVGQHRPVARVRAAMRPELDRSRRLERQRERDRDCAR